MLEKAGTLFSLRLSKNIVANNPCQCWRKYCPNIMALTVPFCFLLMKKAKPIRPCRLHSKTKRNAIIFQVLGIWLKPIVLFGFRGSCNFRKIRCSTFMTTSIQENHSLLYGLLTMVSGEGCNTKKMAKIFHFAKFWVALLWDITVVGIAKQHVASLFLITRSILF